MTTLSRSQLKFKTYLKEQMFSKALLIGFEELESKAQGLASLFFEELSQGDIDEVLKELTIENDIEMDIGGSIVDKSTFTPWIAQRRTITETPRWEAYKQLLVSRDWPVTVINSLDTQTDEVVELLGDPQQSDGTWPRRGLLMGEVQSGKTATYLGILNKALDYGYRVIIVIAGHTENLRRQTQARFDTDLLGVDSETLGENISNLGVRRVGVGIESGRRTNLLTTVLNDFSASKRSSSFTWLTDATPTVFITKKTPSLIENIRNYIKSQAKGKQLDIPIIIVDDESDWGSPNTRSKEDPTSVNRAIRSLLDVSTRTSYLAITATPFANIFIDDQAAFEFVEKPGRGELVADTTGKRLGDLFPSDYIRVLYPPSTYLGIGTYFQDTDHPAIVTDVEDCLETIPIKHKNHHAVHSLPKSMEQAIIEFFLGTSVRRVRDGQVQSASMLINVSRFKSVERSVAELAEGFVSEMSAVILSEFARKSSKRSCHAERIHDIWNKQFECVKDVSWSEVTAKLIEIAGEVRVDLINGDTAKERARRRGQMTVAEREADDLVPKVVVGGDILSRGLTLDGLQVSYFVREPRTMDTLLQMGRWFGYRPNFADLVRIWMPKTTCADFEHSALVTEELRDSLLEMKARDLTPRDFGLRVRVNPNSVAIVAANKGRDTEVIEVGPTVWENRLAESYDLTKDDEVDKQNQIAVDELVARLGSDNSEKTSGGFVAWTNVPLKVVQKFFEEFQGDPDSHWFGRGDNTVPRIFDALKVTPGNDRWTIALVNGSGETSPHQFGTTSVTMSIRNNMGRSRSDGHIRLDRRRVSSGADLIGSLTKMERAEIDQEPAERFVTASGKPMQSQKKTLAWIDHPILMIYTLTADEPKVPDDTDFLQVHVGITRLAVAIAFPKMTQEEIEVAARGSKTYLVNQVYWRAYNGFVEGSDEEDLDEGVNV